MSTYSFNRGVDEIQFLDLTPEPKHRILFPCQHAQEVNTYALDCGIDTQENSLEAYLRVLTPFPPFEYQP